MDHAHNDYLELLAETGVVGFLIVVGGLGWFGWRTLQRWSSRHDPDMRGIVLGGLASVFASGIHSVVDFNLHIPANALLLTVILGITWVAVHLRRHPGRSTVVFRERTLSLPRPLRLALYPVVLLAALALALPVVRDVAADQQAQEAERLERGARDVEALEGLVETWARAVALERANADYHLHLGQAYERAIRAQWTSDPMRALTAGLQAMLAFREAILRHPTSPFPYLAWGWSLENMARLATWSEAFRTFRPTVHRSGGSDLEPVATRLAQHPERIAPFARRLLQTAAYLAPKYAAPILQALWERTRDRDLVRALARGTPEEAKWPADERPSTLAR